MPTSLLYADTSLPTAGDGASAEEKTEEIINYLYMLLEQLRYTLGNLGEENFNAAEKERMGKVLTEPVYAKIADSEAGLKTQLSVTAEGIRGEMSDAVNGLDAKITAEAGKIQTVMTAVGENTASISSLTQTAEGLETRVANSEGNITVLTQTANQLSSRITKVNNSISSKISQAIGEISLSVENGAEGSTLTLKNGTATLGASAQIKLVGTVGLYETDENTVRGIIGYGSSAISDDTSVVLGNASGQAGVAFTESGAKMVAGTAQVYISANTIGVVVERERKDYNYKFTNGEFNTNHEADLGNIDAPWGNLYCNDINIGGVWLSNILSSLG